MALILKKNVVPRFEGDVEKSLAFLKRVEEELDLERGQERDGVIFCLGVEAIIRLGDEKNLDNIADKLKLCTDEGYHISLHAPINPSDPSKVDLTTGEGFRIAEILTEFAEKQKIPLIVAHPNALRSEDPLYPLIGNLEVIRDLNLDILIKNVSRLNKYSPVTFSVENKPYPATDEKNEDVIHSLLCGPFNHLLKLKEAGIPITFDTAHYMITLATIHSALATSAPELKGKPLSLVINPILGLFKGDFEYQPEIANALHQLGESVLEVHLNDAVPYQHLKGVDTYWEGLVPGRGSLVHYTDIIPYLKQQSQKRDISLVMEVYEKNYEKCDNAYECFKGFLGGL